MYDDPDSGIILQPSHQQNTPCGSTEVNGPQTTVGAAGAAGLVQVTDEDDGTPCSLRDSSEALQQTPHLVGTVDVHMTAQVTLDGVQDQQPCVVLHDGLLDPLVQE